MCFARRFWRVRCIKISVRFEFYILISLLLFYLPLYLLLSWLFAALIHELFHYIALRIFRVNVYTLTIGVSGAVMKTGPMNLKEEIISAAAGPFGSIFLLMFARIAPYVALFGFVQWSFNMLPIYPLDGGRILLCITKRYFPELSERICYIVKWVIMLPAAFILVYYWHAWHFVSFAAILYVVRRNVLKFPCKA